MSSSALPDAACQLDSRYWKITTSDGNVEEVQGPGVVGTQPAPPDQLTFLLGSADILLHSACVRVCLCTGEFPIMRPGKVHEYASCTTFSTPSEYMEGHYTFHRLGESTKLHPPANIRCYVTYPSEQESPATTFNLRATSLVPSHTEGDQFAALC